MRLVFGVVEMREMVWDTLMKEIKKVRRMKYE